MIEPFRVLAEDEDLPRWDVPDQLAELYGGAIGLDEPCVVANFVESLDGVVAVPRLPRSHAVIGDESEADRFVLALMRACADAVVVGSGTLLASPKGTWRIDRAYPPAAEALAELRARRGRSEQPLVVVVTTGASLDPAHPVLESGALVLTTEGAAAARARCASRGGRGRRGQRRRHASIWPARWTCCATAAASWSSRRRARRYSDRSSLLGSWTSSSSPSPPSWPAAAPPPGSGLSRASSSCRRLAVAGRLRSVRTHGSHLFLRYGLR